MAPSFPPANLRSTLQLFHLDHHHCISSCKQSRIERPFVKLSHLFYPNNAAPANQRILQTLHSVIIPWRNVLATMYSSQREQRELFRNYRLLPESTLGDSLEALCYSFSLFQ